MLWQDAQEISPFADKRVSLNNKRPKLAFFSSISDVNGIGEMKLSPHTCVHANKNIKKQPMRIILDIPFAFF